MKILFGLVLVGLMLMTLACAAEKSYSVELNSFDRNKNYEDDGAWVDWGTVRMKKVSRNKYTLTGEFEFKKNMADAQKISLQVFAYDEGTKQKGPMVMNVNKPFCQFINEDTDTYPHLQKSSNLPEQGDCPFPKGKYTIDNYELETTFLPDDAPKGDYLLELNLLDNDIGVSGLVATVTLT